MAVLQWATMSDGAATAQGMISVDDAAIEFGLHRTTIYRYIAEGRLAKQRWMGNRKTYLSRASVQELVDTPEVSRCLQLIYDRFRETAVWPVAHELQRQQAQLGTRFDVIAAVEALPAELGWRVRDTEGRAQLSLRGIARCEGSSEDVNAFLGLVKVAYERYMHDENLTITSGDLAQIFDLCELGSERLYQILQVESGLWRGMGKGPDGWNVSIGPDYFAAKQRALQPRQSTYIYPAGVFSEPDADAGHQWHPAIADAAKAVDPDNPGAAVIAAAMALERMLAQRVPTAGSGRALIGQYFDHLKRQHPSSPRIEGVRMLTQGAFAAYRNPAAHGRLDVDLRHAEEIVTLFSLLANEFDHLPITRADTLRVGESTTDQNADKHTSVPSEIAPAT